jgi:hypothetical protein
MNLSQRIALNKARKLDPTNPMNNMQNSAIERNAQVAANAFFSAEVERKALAIIRAAHPRDRVALALQYGIDPRKI